MLEFDFSQVHTVEFGVGRDDEDGRTFCMIAVDGDVQDALREMAEATWAATQKLTDVPPRYEPSEKHSSQEYVYLPVGDKLAERMRELHAANNLPMDSQALADPANIFCYFARITDNQGRRLTALRRASQFKGVLKSRLIRWVTDALQLVGDNVFKLDTNFDLLIDAQNVHILRPSGFEFAGQLQEAIMAAVSTNVTAVKSDLSFVNFDVIENYASQHPRAARYLASIRCQAELKNIDHERLVQLCTQTGVETEEVDGQITVTEKHVMGFLEVLDRRRYEIELVADAPEQYRATSRSKLDAEAAS
ncbi:MAG: Kiwa anti-phage protein KwaB-like domain-containing protein [Pseudomonadota bacterium]